MRIWVKTLRSVLHQWFNVAGGLQLGFGRMSKGNDVGSQSESSDLL